MSLKEKNSLYRAKRINILIVGLGGGGTMIVSRLSQKLKGAHFLAADTDIANLERVKNPRLKTLAFGAEETKGLGTGRNASLAQRAAEKIKKQIDQIVKRADLIVFISSLGGGVGSGALPIFAQAAHEKQILSLGFFTFPFKFEGIRKQKLAQQSLEKTIPYLDGYLIIPNEKIFTLVKGGTFQEAFTLINSQLVDWLESLIHIIRKPGLINVDFSDFKSILKGKEKKLFLNHLKAQGEHRLEKFLKEMDKNNLSLFPLENVKKMLFYIRGGADLKMAEVETISQKIKSLNPAAKIIFGLEKEKGLKGTLEATLFALMGEKKIPVKKKVTSPKKRKPLKKKKEAAPKKRLKKVQRRNALEIHKESQKEEFQKTPKEKEWEIPAFLRRK